MDKVSSFPHIWRNKMKHLEDMLWRNPSNFSSRGWQYTISQIMWHRQGWGGLPSEEFFSTQCPGMSATSSYQQQVHHMVKDYMGSRVDVDTPTLDDPLTTGYTDGLLARVWPVFNQAAGLPFSQCPLWTNIYWGLYNRKRVSSVTQIISCTSSFVCYRP